MLTRDHVLALAREAGLSIHSTACDLAIARFEGRDPALDLSGSIHNLECFAALVAAGEREACAQVLSDAADRLTPEGKRINQVDRHVAAVLLDKSASIRARCTP